MGTGEVPSNVERLLGEILGSTPLPFIHEFLRTQRGGGRRVKIGTTREEARKNLRDAIRTGAIQAQALEDWYREIEGWGKQHLYLLKVGGRLSLLPHLMSSVRLRSHLTKAELMLRESAAPTESHPSRLEDVDVDDAFARLVWRTRADGWERHEELDETRRLKDDDDDGEGEEYVFRAWRRMPRRAASRFVIRKTDGTAIILLTHPIGDEHTEALAAVHRVAAVVLPSLQLASVPLSQVVGALDENAVRSTTTAKSRHGVDLQVESRQTRFRTEGARVQFQSTDESHGYTQAEPVRRVRRAMEVAKFIGENGKFGLKYEADGKIHSVVASLDATHGRSYLFSRMKEGEVWAFVDQVLELAQ